MRRKRCRCCQELYRPDARSYRQQKTCAKPSCRAWRIRWKWKRWIGKDPLYGRSRRYKLKQWRQSHKGYWRAWRKSHPGYVRRNRRAQRYRNARNRGLIAKPTGINELRREKLMGIKSLHLIAKPTEREEILIYKIDGICRYLEWEMMIAKPTDMDTKDLCLPK